MKSGLFVLVGKDDNNPFIKQVNGKNIEDNIDYGLTRLASINIATAASGLDGFIVPVFSESDVNSSIFKQKPLEDFLKSHFILRVNKTYSTDSFIKILSFSGENLDSLIVNSVVESEILKINSTSDEDAQEDIIRLAEIKASEINNRGRLYQLAYLISFC